MPRAARLVLKPTAEFDDASGVEAASHAFDRAPRPAPASAPRVLVVDADAEVRNLVAGALRPEGMAVRHADDGPSAVAAAVWRPQVVVLDVGLPRMNGLEVMARLRRADDDVAVILLTEPDAEGERVLGFEMGADDCVVKPFSPRELAARVRAVLRRRGGRPSSAPIVAGPLRVEVAERRVVLDGQVVELTPKEFDLLAFLAAAPAGRVFSRAELLEHVWSSSAEWQDPATVTEHVRRLRLRIEADAGNPRLLQTVRGVGYRFEPDAA